MAGRANVLSDCAAVACCSLGAPFKSLERFAKATGFGLFVHYLDVAELRARPAPIIYFLLHFATPDAEKAETLARLRQYPSPKVRLAPVILIAQDCDATTFLSYVQMGFDDILCLPEQSQLLVDRLTRQLNQDIVYIETADYFGPDRRRMEVPGAQHAARRSTAHMHSRLIVHRSLADGPVILERQDHWDNIVH